MKLLDPYVELSADDLGVLIEVCETVTEIMEGLSNLAIFDPRLVIPSDTLGLRALRDSAIVALYRQVSS